jgi:hypothetical protein
MDWSEFSSGFCSTLFHARNVLCAQRNALEGEAALLRQRSDAHKCSGISGGIFAMQYWLLRRIIALTSS